MVLSLNHGKGVNALCQALVAQLSQCLSDIYADNSLRVLIMRSTVSGVFCAGADLKERAFMADPEIEAFVAKLKSIADGIADIPVPTIVAMDGAAIGGGLEFALAADIRVVSDNVKLGLSETKLAIIPGAGI
ncbi:unnamed protein product [Oppiella nova]|uniref:Enoyl-CoA hydratase n=1 Tax=Oppiella nova TaxID=334625 RepID=A0A7R9ME28_9ACAR|nr:unnamed protein product [Oppiella nova]CAG2175539.1 unnamed protein product [Oppiella nova]